MLAGLLTGFAALVSRLLPLLQLLLELFQPGDGQKLTRVQKVITLCYMMLILYGFFVSYAYVTQYHGLVEATSRLHYLEQSLLENEKDLVTERAEKNELSSRLFSCLEAKSYKQPVVSDPAPQAPPSPPKDPTPITNNRPEAVVRNKPYHSKHDDSDPNIRRVLLEELNKKE